MIRCPRCGGRRSDDNDCVCGGAREAAEIRTDGGQGPTDPRRGGQNDQPQQGGNNQQPPGNQQPQQGGQQQARGRQRGQQRGNPSAGAPAGQGDDGVDRRTLLLGGGGALAVLGGGWFFFLREDGEPTDSPDSAAQAYVEALTSADTEQAKELAHADSPAQVQIETTDTGFFESIAEADVDVSVDATTVDEDPGLNADDYDSVEEFQAVEVSIGVQGEEDTIPGVAAKNTDGEWKMWSLGLR